ncbi:hypothetical protein D3C72_2368180 [compost metagenome]
MHRAGTAKPLGGQGLPLAAGAQHIHNGLEHQAGRFGGASGARLAAILLGGIALGLGDQGLHPPPELVRDFP